MDQGDRHHWGDGLRHERAFGGAKVNAELAWNYSARPPATGETAKTAIYRLKTPRARRRSRTMPSTRRNALEFVEDRDTRRFFDPARKVGPAIAAALLKRGVIARAMPQGDILGFAPPLCITVPEADEVVHRAAEAVAEVLG